MGGGQVGEAPGGEGRRWGDVKKIGDKNLRARVSGRIYMESWAAALRASCKDAVMVGAC